MKEIQFKYKDLKSKLKEYHRLLVAYSGGIDSAFLLKSAHEVLGDHVLAVTADSPAVPRSELQQARNLAREIGARHRIIQTKELANENYRRNPSNRCYFCKCELYSQLVEIADRQRIQFIANGTNIDDLGDYRPGLQAADEFRVVSPLRDAGLTKQDIRMLAKQLDLPIWDKPASPCLASRIPYGRAVSQQKLAMVEQAEAFLKSYGIRELRVRHFDDTARIEINREDFETVQRNLTAITENFQAIGFARVEVTEFRSGALNPAIGQNV